MAWLVLFASGLLETAWAVALKQSDGFSKPGWTGAFAITAAASLAGLAYALKSLPVGSAYAVWTGRSMGRQMNRLAAERSSL